MAVNQIEQLVLRMPQCRQHLNEEGDFEFDRGTVDGLDQNYRYRLRNDHPAIKYRTIKAKDGEIMLPTCSVTRCRESPTVS